MLPAAQKCQKPLFWSTRWCFHVFPLFPIPRLPHSSTFLLAKNKKVLSRLTTNQRITKKDLMCADLSVISPVEKVSKKISSRTGVDDRYSSVILCIASCKGRVRGACFPSGGKPSRAPSSCFTHFNIRRTKTIDDPCFRMATVPVSYTHLTLPTKA